MTNPIEAGVGGEPVKRWGTDTALGVSAYARPGCWLYVTVGLSDLWGEELTMRVLDDASGRPPEWAPLLLERLGELVVENARPFAPGARMEALSTSGLVPPAYAWAFDPELPPVTTAHGLVQFVATLGVSFATLERMRREGTRKVIDEIARKNPLLVTGGPGLTW